MIRDAHGRVLIYDAFLRNGTLYLIATYTHYNDAMTVEVNSIRAEEVGHNEYEPVRYFRVPCAAIPTHIHINGVSYSVPTGSVDVLPCADASGFAVATLFKDDHPFLPQMIDWYRAQGATQFYLYYNGPSLPAGLPTGPDILYRTWNFLYWNTGAYFNNKEKGWAHAAQTAFLTTACLRYLPAHTWTALVDIDEALHANDGRRLVDALQDIPPEYDCVRVRNYWSFRSHDRILYSVEPEPWTSRTKCMVRGSYTGLCGVHSPKAGARCLDSDAFRMYHIVNCGHSNRLPLVKEPRGQVPLPAKK